MVGRRVADGLADALPFAADHQNRLAARAAGVKILPAKFGRRNGVTLALHRFQRPRQVVRRQHRHAEHAAHRRSQRLCAVEIRAAWAENRAVKPRRIRRAQNRADVAGVLHPVERDEPPPRQRLRRLGNPRRADDALRRFRRADCLHHRR